MNDMHRGNYMGLMVDTNGEVEVIFSNEREVSEAYNRMRVHLKGEGSENQEMAAVVQIVTEWVPSEAWKEVA